MHLLPLKEIYFLLKEFFLLIREAERRGITPVDNNFTQKLLWKVSKINFYNLKLYPRTRVFTEFPRFYLNSVNSSFVLYKTKKKKMLSTGV